MWSTKVLGQKMPLVTTDAAAQSLDAQMLCQDDECKEVHAY